MKIIGKIALVLTGAFVAFLAIGIIVLSATGGVRNAFQYAYDHYDGKWSFPWAGSTHFMVSGDYDADMAYGDEQALPLNGAALIEIKAQGSYVELTRGAAGSEVTAELNREGYSQYKLGTSNKDGELKIYSLLNGFRGGSHNSVTLKISIPSDFKGDFILEFDGCDVTAGNLETQGDITLEINACQFQSDALKGGNLTVNLNAGDAEISGIDGRLDWSQNMGNGTLRFERVSGDISVDSNVGNMDLYFPENSGLQISASSRMGDVDNRMKKNGPSVSGALYEVNITSTMGSVNLHDE